MEREYYCTYGVLWTGAYPESERVLEGKNGHSMELDPKTFKGTFTTKNGKKCFAVSEASFLALCILGENVEPCFEGGKFEGIDVETDFSLIKKEFQEMMTSLKNYQYNGGDVMDKRNIRNFAVAIDDMRSQLYKQLDEKFNYYCIAKINIGDVMNSVVIVSWDHGYNDEYYRFDFSVMQDIVTVDLESMVRVYILDVTEEEKATLSVTNMSLGGNIVDKETTKVEATVATEPVVNIEFTKAIEEKDATISQQSTELAELREYKLAVERKEKQTLIDKYTMIADDDKKEYLTNIDKYTLADIEAKLAVQLVNSKPELFSVATSVTKVELEPVVETTEPQAAPNFALNDVAIGNNVPKATSWMDALVAREV